MNVLEMRDRFEWPESFYRTSANPDFLALALCGEIGELAELLFPLTIASGKLANLMKKGWRGDGYNKDEIKNEIADVRIYLELLAKHFDLAGEDMMMAVWQKMQRKAFDLGAKQK